MKKLFAILVAMMLVLGSAAAETAAETAAEPETDARYFTMKKVPMYLEDISEVRDGDQGLPLWFLEGAEDLPFIDVADWAKLMTVIMTDDGKTQGYELKIAIDQDDNEVILTRENGYQAWLNFDRGTIEFSDYIACIMMPNIRYMDLIHSSSLSQDGSPFLLTVTGSRDRYGDVTVLDLKKYGIPMIVQDQAYLVPLQTLSAFFLAPNDWAVYFNGEATFVADVSRMTDPMDNLNEWIADNGVLTPEFKAEIGAFEGTQEERTEFLLNKVSAVSDEGAAVVDLYREEMETGMYARYASVSRPERSPELAEFGYDELCLELDCMYGLKEAHNIRSFDLFFQQTGLDDLLMDPDAEKADQAIADLTQYWFDDGHSGLISASYMASQSPTTNLGYSSEGKYTHQGRVEVIRQEYSDAYPSYLEIGDTAYVTFDAFNFAEADTRNGIPDYYALAEKDELPADTIGIISDAHRKITRENSPIRNVVLDLSCNGGGAVPAAAYTICWFLGDGEISQHNTFTGAQSTMTYQADINLDRVYDEKDTLVGRGLNLYCLISPNSFSCGNLVPWAFKEDGRVTLLGKVSGGGSCIVQYMTTAWGTSFQISGFSRAAFVKNGSYYDVDRGVEPDHIIDTYEHFFDRNALTEYIHGLY